MTLWNIIRDFFVQYIFGGFDSNGSIYATNSIGNIFAVTGGFLDDNINANSSGLVFKINFLTSDLLDESYSSYISLGDWLSTTATIITLCAICVFLFFFVRWLFRLTAGLVSGRC